MSFQPPPPPPPNDPSGSGQGPDPREQGPWSTAGQNYGPGGYGQGGHQGGPQDGYGQGGYPGGPGGPGGYGPGYGAGGFGPGGGEHPEGQKLLVISIIALFCCAPVNIWVLVHANGLLKGPSAQSYNMSKVSTAKVIAIISLVLWALGALANITTGASYDLSVGS